ncbi:hypothetical protein F0562_010403 [Nyssa sinensis]|uniref:Uncharacterized protein n=1 Tax=Nyssa sinensis TaxID=561372 RepID=A0A5J5A285_9ASTE|nr:hypothetical protein F0562_010403 [Nyssa sinensis]
MHQSLFFYGVNKGQKFVATVVAGERKSAASLEGFGQGLLFDGAGGMYQNYQGQETVEPESRMGNFPDEHQNAAGVTGDVQEVERSQVSAYSED